MKSFFIGLVVVLSLFSLCLIVSYIIDLLKPQKNNEPTEREKNAENGDKVYYITNYQHKKKKPRIKKTPDIALKGIVLKPEQFHKIYVDDENVHSKME